MTVKLPPCCRLAPKPLCHSFKHRYRSEGDPPMTGTYGVPLAGYPFRTPISSARADCTSDRRPREP
jgi:hypothetical protein